MRRILIAPLILQVHPASPIIDFYPIDFRMDLNGKKFFWQAIALLPFIDAARLRASLAPLDTTLEAEEARRNAFGAELLFARASSPLGALIVAATAHHGAASAGAPLDISPYVPGFGGALSWAGTVADGPLMTADDR